VNCPVWRCG